MKTDLIDTAGIINVIKPYTVELIEEKITEKCKEIAENIARDIIRKYEIKDMIFKQTTNKNGEILVLVKMKIPKNKLKIKKK